MIAAALAVLFAWGMAEAFGRGRRWPLLLAMVPLLGLLTWRGIQVRWVPFTNKYEAFLTFAVAVLGVAALRHPRLGRPGRLLLGAVATAFVATPLAWDDALHFPSPLLVTGWYAVHVPLSFVAYAFWLAAAADGLDWAIGARDTGAFLRNQDTNVRTGLATFSVAMIFGSIWGVVSWGAYFLWDPKILWSLAAWVAFGTFAHARFWSNAWTSRGRKRGGWPRVNPHRRASPSRAWSPRWG